MDRMIVYQGAVPLSSDILWTNKFAMFGLARLTETLIGTSTGVSGLACTPTAPASLNVNVAYGSIYQQVAADATAYGVLAADPTLLMKQGNIPPIIPGGTTAQVFAITPPGTPGQSQAYLIQATYADVDAVPVTLLYLNTSNPPASYVQPWAGPNNSGVAQNTNRDGMCVLNLKAGTPATTGTQATPAPDAGYVGLWVITVANGAATIIAGNITTYSGAPFLPTLAAAATAAAFRMPLQIVAPYGTPSAVAGVIADTPTMVFSKANTPGVFWSFPVTAQVSTSANMKLRIMYTTDLNGGNCAMQLAYQSFVAGSPISPASYVSNLEAIAAPATANNFIQALTATAIIPSSALVSNGFVNCVLTRQGGNGLDTNLGNLHILQITLEQ